MDEDEYEDYMHAIERLQYSDPQHQELTEQLRDEDGFRVEGCYVTLPANA